MVGKSQIQIGPNDFLKGMGTNDYANDGGFSPLSYGINLGVKPGALYSAPTKTDVSTNLSGNIIASCEDGQGGSNPRYFIDDGANFYTYTGTSLLKKRTGAKTYTVGISDGTPYNGDMYFTSTTDIAKWTYDSAFTEDWWTGTLSESALSSGLGQPHPLLVFEKILWIGDANVLRSYDGSSVTAALTLGSNETIYALGIDPGTGLMLISVATDINDSDTYPAKNIIYMFDGYSTKPRRKIIVDDLVTAFHPMGSTVFTPYGTNLGYWNGSGISFLRKLDITYDSQTLVFKHRITNIGNTLYFTNKSYLVAFGEVQSRGQKVFYNIIRNLPSGARNIGFVTNVGSGKLLYADVNDGSNTGYNTATTIDTTDATTSSGATLYMNNALLPRPIFVRRVRVFTTGISSTSAFGTGSFVIQDETTNTTNSRYFINTSATPQYVFDFDFSGLKLQSLQVLLGIGTKVYGVTRFIIYYDPAE